MLMSGCASVTVESDNIFPEPPVIVYDTLQAANDPLIDQWIVLFRKWLEKETN